MTPADAAELLTIAAAFDRRKIGRADAIAWADALAGLDPKDCAEAVRAHFRESTDYLMPVHVRHGVKRLRAERIRATNSATLEPHDVDPDDVHGYLTAGRARRAEIASGRPVSPEPTPTTTAPIAALMKVADKAWAMPPALPRNDGRIDPAKHHAGA